MNSLEEPGAALDDPAWQIENGRRLSGRLSWLRRRLEGFADAGLPAPDLPPPDGAAAMPLTLAILQRQFGLSDFETDCLFLCAAMEFDSRIPELCAVAQSSPQRMYPTAALCMQLFENPAWDFLSPERPLRKRRLLEFHRREHVPFTACPMTADERIANFVKGLNHLDERVALFLHPLDCAKEGPLSISQAEAACEAVCTLHEQAAPKSLGSIVALLSPRRAEARLFAAQIAAHLDVKLKRIAADALPHSVEEIDGFARLWNRECRLLPMAMYVELEAEATEAAWQRLRRLLARVEGLVVLHSFDKPFDEAALQVNVPRPTALEQRQAWEQSLGERHAGLAPMVSGHFDFSIAQIETIARTWRSCLPVEKEPAPETLWDRCRTAARPNLENLAQRIDVKAGWEDLVLPEDDLALLRQLAAQVRNRTKVLDEWGFRDKLNRGYGVTALFAGESGTGKTMAAEVIASHLRLDLYRVDLSTVINKYIGETETNLKTIFDSCEEVGAVLLFDEADALFGKRSEVKDSHDRYANIEVNYLLQRLETFRGVAILATNNKSALDAAFLRRLRFVIDFRFPELPQRKEIWRRVFPQQTPLAGLDVQQLGRLRVAGGNIHNIALNAAFAAASDKPHVDMSVILSSARAELHKIQKPLTTAGLAWPAPQESFG